MHLSILINKPRAKPFLIATWYRSPNSPAVKFSHFETLLGILDAENIEYYYMAFQNSLFCLVDKRSVKTQIRTVVRIFCIWTGVPDVVYLAGNFCFGKRKNFCFLICQLCFTCKTKLFLIEHACLPYIVTQ